MLCFSGCQACSQSRRAIPSTDKITLALPFVHHDYHEQTGPPPCSLGKTLQSWSLVQTEVTISPDSHKTVNLCISNNQGPRSQAPSCLQRTERSNKVQHAIAPANTGSLNSMQPCVSTSSTTWWASISLVQYTERQGTFQTDTSHGCVN